jgi:hypothetical protein
VRTLVAAALALACTSCFVLGRESYTSLAGAGAAQIAAPPRVSIAADRTGAGFAQDPVAVRAGAPDGVVVSVCDWAPGFWLPVFPPIPIPILSMDREPGMPDTTLVRITFETAGNWRAAFSDIALLGPENHRAQPFMYRIVLADKAESLGEHGTASGALEPCTRADDPSTSVERAKVAVLEGGELWLLFDTQDFPSGPRELALDGFTRNDKRVPIPRLALEPGSRWYWYRAFP